jgi:hypothetical protein
MWVVLAVFPCFVTCLAGICEILMILYYLAIRRYQGRADPSHEVSRGDRGSED